MNEKEELDKLYAEYGRKVASYMEKRADGSCSCTAPALVCEDFLKLDTAIANLSVRFPKGTQVYILETCDGFSILHCDVVGVNVNPYSGKACYNLFECDGRRLAPEWWRDEAVFATKEELIAYYKDKLNK